MTDRQMGDLILKVLEWAIVISIILTVVVSL